MASQWLVKWPIAGSLLVYYISNVKGRESDVFLPQMEWLHPRGGIGTTSRPRCGAWPHARTLLLCWEEPDGSQEAGLLIPGETVCPCVQRSSAQVARHSQSVRLTQQPVSASTARRQIQCALVVRISYVHGSLEWCLDCNHHDPQHTSHFMLRHFHSAVSPTMQDHLSKALIKTNLEILCFNLKLMGRFAIQFRHSIGVQGQIKMCQDFL